MTLYEPHIWEDGAVGYRLKPWAALVNIALLTGFLWCLIWASVGAAWRIVAEVVR